MPTLPSSRRKRRRRLFLLLALVLHQERTRRRRAPMVVRERGSWDAEVERLRLDNNFEKTYRMSVGAFNRLLQLITPALDRHPHAWVNRQPVPNATKLQCLLRYLAGGSLSDIRCLCGVSLPHCYKIIYGVMDAIIATPSLKIKLPRSPTEIQQAAAAFKLRSKGGVLEGCIGAMDGWVCDVLVPPVPRDAAGPRAHYRRHYTHMGINVQACCDAFSRFTYLDITHTAAVDDAWTYRDSPLPDVVETLDRGVYIVADNGYEATDHLLTPFLASELQGDAFKMSYNYHVSQLRMRIDMAFGLLMRKWAILQRPLRNSLPHDTKMIHCAAILHNFVITERLTETKDQVFEVSKEKAAVDHTTVEALLSPTSTDQESHVAARRSVRDALVDKLRRRNQLRPHEADDTE